MKHVWIAQLKCPANHAILALAHECEDAAEAEKMRPILQERFETLVAANSLKRECALCLATDLHITLDRTRFATMAEAEPYLLESQRQQILIAQMLRGGRN